MRVIKRDGREVPFDSAKIRAAVDAANREETKRRLSETEVDVLVDHVERKCAALDRAVHVEEIQDMVIDAMDFFEKYSLARRYSEYRLRHELKRRQNTTDRKVLSLLRHDNELAVQENANKDPVINSTMRDYLASEVSEDICRRYLFPEDIMRAHDEGVIHIHDMSHPNVKLSTKDFFAEFYLNSTSIRLSG